MLKRVYPITALCTMMAAAVILLIAGCGDNSGSSDTAAPTPSPFAGYLTEEIPPCTPIEESSIDPCEPDVELTAGPAGGMSGGPILRNTPRTIRSYLDGDSIISISHIVLRGTFIPGTVRCETGVPNREPSYIEGGGFFHATVLLQCYSDVRVNEYIIGSGPSRLPLLVKFHHYWEGEYREGEEVLQGLTEEQYMARLGWVYESVFENGTYQREGMSGRELILFINPPHSTATEVWEVVTGWDVQRMDDDTVVAIHPLRDSWRRLRPNEYQTHRSSLEMPLSAFKQAAMAAHQARLTEYSGRIGPADMDGKAEGATLPMLETDANRLRQFLTNTGAYNHPDGPPSMPPLAYICSASSARAISDPGLNPGLVHGCEALLASKDTLRGTGTLNWSTSISIGGWDGITTGTSDPWNNLEVTKVEVPNEGLTGSIPAQLSELMTLTHLDLSNNSLAGEIPAALSQLKHLESIKLSGNNLTGCVPVGLKDVPTNDLPSLNLPYCSPPPPGNLSASAIMETTVTLSWDTTPNTSKYRVEYISLALDEWVMDDDSITGTSHTVDGFVCNKVHGFRVSAYGSGTEYAAAWSDWTEALIVDTGECMSPVFEEAEYKFELVEDAPFGDAVGAVSATHPDDDTIEYSITAGNTGNAFAIGASSGAITVAGALDFETTPSYTLTVQAEDDDEDTDTVTVTINVTDVVEDPPPAPTGLSATLTAGVFTLTWDELAGVAKYEAQHKTDAADSEWTALPETTAATQTCSRGSSR